MAATPSFARRYRAAIIISLLLCLTVLVVYGQVAGHSFVNFDDNVYVTDNAHVRDGWSVEGFKWAFTADLHGHWHPMTWLSHMTDVQLFGMNPTGHHLTSVAIHLATTLLIFLLLRRMTGARYRSALVAALFALHPLHVESVAWVADRKDVLAGFFFVLTLWAYAAYTERGTAWRYFLVMVCFSLALMSKTIAVTAPAIMLLMDLWPLGRFSMLTTAEDRNKGSTSTRFIRQAARLVLEKWGFFLLALLAVVVTFSAIEDLEVPVQQLSDWFLANVSVRYVFYLAKTFWPADLSLFYSYYTHVPAWKIGCATLILAGLSVLSVLWAKKRPYFIMGWAWYLVTLLPVIGITESGPIRVADRYTYLPLIGLFIMVAWGLAEIPAARGCARRVFAAIAITLSIAAATMSLHQARYWKDSVTLMSRAVELRPDNWVALNNLGDALEEAGRQNDAIETLKRAVRAKPDYAKSHFNLGNALAKAGENEAAAASYLRTIQLTPGHARAHHNLGVVLEREDRLDEAAAHYRSAVALDPVYAQAYRHLGDAHAKAGNHGDALEAYETYLSLEPEDAAMYDRVGDMMMRSGRLEEAIDHYEAALRIDPGLAETHNNLGVTLARMGRLDEAVAHFKKALQLDSELEGAQTNLTKAQEILKGSKSKSHANEPNSH